MPYVIQLAAFNGKYKAGAYVTRPGSEHSYTYKLERAQTFPTRERAAAACSENERAVSVAALMGDPRLPR